MKIGILTQPLSSNYGGILQNYALQTVLKRMGHEPYTFRTGKLTYVQWLFVMLKAVVRLFVRGKWLYIEPPTKSKHRLQGMERFISNNINIASYKRWYSKKDVMRLNPDLLVVGSDQVWRPRYNRRVEDLFFAFLGSSEIPRIAYAASFGAGDWEFTDKQRQACRNLIKNFRAVSVREENGVDLCKRYLDYDNAQWVLDPTLLLTSEDYEALCVDLPRREKFVFAYILDEDEEKQALCERIAKSKNLPLHLVSAHDSLTMEDTPECWLSNFRDAAFVVTDSFHGTAFSLIFHKDFLTLRNTKRGNARFDSLIKQFDIAERVITDTQSNSDATAPVMWDKIDVRMNEWRDKSLRFLHDNVR